MNKFLREFKEFAMKGNVIDLAVGVIIGATFNAIVTSLVNDIITPFLGVIIGGINISKLQIVVPGLFNAANAIKYGSFLQSVLNFLIAAFSIFLLIRIINRLHKKQIQKNETVQKPSATELLLIEIRDLLKSR